MERSDIRELEDRLASVEATCAGAGSFGVAVVTWARLVVMEVEALFAEVEALRRIVAARTDHLV